MIRTHSSYSAETVDHTALVAHRLPGTHHDSHTMDGNLRQMIAEATKDCLRMDYPDRMDATAGIHKGHPHRPQMAWPKTGRKALQTNGFAWKFFPTEEENGIDLNSPEYAFILFSTSFQAFDSQNPGQDVFF